MTEFENEMIELVLCLHANIVLYDWIDKRPNNKKSN